MCGRRELGCLIGLIALLTGCGGMSGEPPSLSSVTITPRGAVIAKYGVVEFRATGSYNDGSSRTLDGVQWGSSVPAVATINPQGTATGLSPGTTIIRGEIGGLRD